MSTVALIAILCRLASDDPSAGGFRDADRRSAAVNLLRAILAPLRDLQDDASVSVSLHAQGIEVRASITSGLADLCPLVGLAGAGAVVLRRLLGVPEQGLLDPGDRFDMPVCAFLMQMSWFGLKFGFSGALQAVAGVVDKVWAPCKPWDDVDDAGVPVPLVQVLAWNAV